MRIRLINSFTDFGKGIIAGFLISAIVFAFVMGLVLQQYKVKEIVEYAEKLQAIEDLREDYVNRDPGEFFEIPGVRGAADNAAAEFERNRDEILFRFRSRIAD